MKRCGKCGKENNDDMRFCLECGNQLADAPFVVNLQNDTTPNQSNVRTDNFGQQQFGNQSGNQYVPPDYPTTARSRKSNSKIFLVVGGVIGLLLLLFMGVAAIVVYNVMSKETAVVTTTPTPTKSVEKESPTPKSSTTPQTSPSQSNRKPTLSDDENTTNNSGITVKFDGVETDYNVQQNGQKGMLMKPSFSVSGMKGKSGYLSIHFQKRDGTPLPANGQKQYRDVNGNLAAFQEIKPDYDDTVYSNLELFLPYDELDLPVGKHDLKMVFDLLDGDGVRIEHLSDEDFWYEQK